MTLNAKLELLQQYYKLTFLAVSSTDPEEIFSFVNKRDKIIEQLKQLDPSDLTASDESSKQLVNNILVLEADLAKKMEKLKQEAEDRLSTVQNAKKLRNQYEQMYEMTDGAFYDKRG